MVASICAQCGKSFEHKASQARVCCSTTCAAKYRNRRLLAEGRYKRPSKPRRGDTVLCVVCAREFYRSPAEIKAGRQLCSVTCANKAQTKTPVAKVCAQCGKPMALKPSQAVRQYCSKACEAAARVKRPLDRWHNGKQARQDDQGYVLVWQPDHPNKAFKGWQYEHRLVAEHVIGRFLDSSEHVHHVNGVKDDNRPENLAVLDGAAHAVLTAVEYRDWLRRELAELAEYRRRYGLLEQEE